MRIRYLIIGLVLLCGTVQAANEFANLLTQSRATQLPDKVWLGAKAYHNPGWPIYHAAGWRTFDTTVIPAVAPNYTRESMSYVQDTNDVNAAVVEVVDVYDQATVDLLTELNDIEMRFTNSTETILGITWPYTPTGVSNAKPYLKNQAESLRATFADTGNSSAVRLQAQSDLNDIQGIINLWREAESIKPGWTPLDIPSTSLE